MAWVSHANQGGFFVPRFHFSGADRARPRSIFGPGPACRSARDSRVAQLLLQVAHDGAQSVSRARSLHSADEAEEHAAMDDGRGSDHAPGAGVLRLRMLKAAPRQKSRRRMGLRALRKVIVRIGFSAA